MVLQRAPARANIFGWADFNANVTVSFNNQDYPLLANSEGCWLVSLPPTEAGGPYDIIVSTDAGDKEILSNVLFGEVWLCGGQSNMQFTVASGFNASQEIQAADNYPNIRVFSVGQDTFADTPLNELNSIAMPWSVASSKTIGAGNWTEFSAVCWFTGRNLYDQYQVPMGLISNNWGGTIIQAWSATYTLQKCNQTTQNTQYPVAPNLNTDLYNAMIYPFLNTQLKGVLWYQGEQNWFDSDVYPCMFQNMIYDWRQAFANHDFVFLFVQLSAPMGPDLRQAQLAALTLPNVGFATAADLGYALGPFGEYHPLDKQDVGKRLTLAARNIAYGESDVVWQGPMFESATQSTSGNTASIQVTWRMFGSGGLVMKNASCPKGIPQGQDCENWVVSFSSGNSTNSTNVQINGNVVTIQVTVPSGATVTAVSYGWAPWPLMNLYSEQDLPAIPFTYNF